MNIKKRQEVINLMPWYNLGKLSAEEKLMVDDALTEDPSLAKQLALDQSIMSKVVADPKLLDRSAFAPSTVRLDKVLAQIDEGIAAKTEKKPSRKVKVKKQPVDAFAGLKAFFGNLISGSSHSFTYAVFAALTVVQLALLMFFVVPSTMPSSTFEAASGSSRSAPAPAFDESMTDNNPSSLVLLIAMKDNIPLEGFTTKTFGRLELELLPSNSGYYRVRLDKKLTTDQIEVLKNELSHKTANVIFVGEEFQTK